MKKWIPLTTVIIAVSGIFFLTFQQPAETVALAEMVRSWLGSIGIPVETKPLRHYIHYVMYFVLGLAVCGYCVHQKIPLRTGLIVGCGIGMMDELLKIALPTREFDLTDLLRDFVGVVAAMLLIRTLRRTAKV